MKHCGTGGRTSTTDVATPPNRRSRDWPRHRGRKALGSGIIHGRLAFLSVDDASGIWSNLRSAWREAACLHHLVDVAGLHHVAYKRLGTAPGQKS